MRINEREKKRRKFKNIIYKMRGDIENIIFYSYKKKIRQYKTMTNAKC